MPLRAIYALLLRACQRYRYALPLQMICLMLSPPIHAHYFFHSCHACSIFIADAFSRRLLDFRATFFCFSPLSLRVVAV